MAPSEIATMAQAALSTLEEATTAIALNLENLQQLNSLVSSVETLVQTGYVVKKLTENELKKKMRCTTCGIRSESPRESRLVMSADTLCSQQENPTSSTEAPICQSSAAKGRGRPCCRA